MIKFANNVFIPISFLFLLLLFFFFSLNQVDADHATLFDFLSEPSTFRLKRQVAEEGNANQFFDELLNNTKELIAERGYDPLNVGKIDICSSCQLEGLTTIKRTGDTTLAHENESIILRTNVGFEELRGTCQCAKKILFITFRGQLRAVLRELAISASIKTGSTGGIQPFLEDFAVTNKGHLDLQWNGKGILAFLSEAVFKLFKGKFIRHAQDALPGLLRSAIESNLHRVSSLAGP